MAGIPFDLGRCFYRNRLSLQGREFYDTLAEMAGRQLEALTLIITSGEIKKSTNYYEDEHDREARRQMAVSSLSAYAPVSDLRMIKIDLREAFWALRDDRPEFFFIGDKKPEYRLLGDRAELIIYLLYTFEEMVRLQGLFIEKIGEVTAGTEKMSEILGERTIYKRITNQVSYVDHKDIRDHNAVGAVLKNEAVCEGCNALFMLCLRKAGIPCIKVYGKSRRHRAHCWTVVWIDGAPKHCDATWDLSGQSGGLRYFNLNDHQIRVDHSDIHYGRLSRPDGCIDREIFKEVAGCISKS